MNVCGVIAEYDPFHTGHRYHIQETRSRLGEDCAVLCVMSGNFVQRGSPALFPKHLRAKAALLAGADLVLELPLAWAMAPADRFALGAVRLLKSTGIVTHLSFGSEETDVSRLKSIAKRMGSEAADRWEKTFLDEGASLPAAKQKAAEVLLGPEDSALLRRPNAMLAAAYLRAMKRIGAAFQPVAVLRAGASHDAPAPEAGFAAGTYLRRCFLAGDAQRAAPFLPQGQMALWQEAIRAGLGPTGLFPGGGNRVSGGGDAPGAGEAPVGSGASAGPGERAVLARLRGMRERDWEALPEVGGGLSARLFRAARRADSLKALLEESKTKRYTLAHLRRCVLRAYLGVTAGYMDEAPPYLRVLGFTKRGQALLAQMRHTAQRPVVVKFADGVRLGGAVSRHLLLEAEATDLYGLCTPQIQPGKLEWIQNPIQVDEMR